MLMTNRENKLRTIRFERPDYIPVLFAPNPSIYPAYEADAIAQLFETHPIIAGGSMMRWDLVHEKNEEQYHRTFFDEFGVEWEETIEGMRGAVCTHPLADFAKIRDYSMPALPVFDPEKEREWVKQGKENGHFMGAGLPHGHTFLRLTDLCGYEDTMVGMAEEDEDLKLLIDKIEEYNFAFVDNWSKCGYDMISYPEDLGMQIGPMISPDLFRKYIKPSYQRLMKPARDSGAIVHMHSDGDIRALADDLLDGGVDILNLQDLVNGIDWIKDRYAGHTCIDLDIDRQKVTVFGTPAEIDELIRYEVESLSSPAGGLMLTYGWYPGTPLENVKAVMDALEKYMFYWN